MKSSRLRIMVVDDHVILREGLVSLLMQQPDFEIVGEAGSQVEAVEKALELKPDLVLMDIGLPDGSGLEATKAILARQPDIQIVILTIHEADELLFDAIRSGARGYLLKNTPIAKLVSSLRGLQQGEAVISRKQTSRVLEEFFRQGRLQYQVETSLGNLTRREIEVLELIGTGASNLQIADRLIISENTVKNHVHSILNKLKLKNRREAARFARRQKWPYNPVDPTQASSKPES